MCVDNDSYPPIPPIAGGSAGVATIFTATPGVFAVSGPEKTSTHREGTRGS